MKIGLTPADQNLVDRLEKLKDDKNKSPPPSETELRRRLAQLKGENFVETSHKNLVSCTTHCHIPLNSLKTSNHDKFELNIQNNFSSV